MSNPADAIPRFSKGGARIALTTTISDASESIDFILNEIGIGALPKPRKAVTDWGMSAAGHIKPEAENVTLGLAMPSFTIETPITIYTAALFLTSFFQNADYTGVATYLFDMVPWTAPSAALFMLVEGGVDGAHVWHANGCIVRDLTINVPALGEDGGHPTFRAAMVGANATRDTAFSASEAGVATDTAPRKLSSEFAFQIGGVAKKFTSAELTFSNSAERSPNIGSTPDAFNLGSAKLSGSINVVMTSAASDEYDALLDAHEAGTATTIYIGVGSHFYVEEQVLFGSPEEEEQGNILVAKFPIAHAIYSSSGYPKARVYSSVSYGNILTPWGIA